MRSPIHHLTQRSRWLTLALAALLVLSALPQPVAAQPSTPQPGLDLAALVLGPADLDAVGMPGYGADLGRSYFTPEEILDPDVILFGRLWSTPALVPGAETLLTSETWRRYHEMHVVTPVQNGLDPILVGAAAVSGIEEYASPEDAAAGFALFTSDNALGTLDPTTVVTLLPITMPLGDEAVMARSATSVGEVTNVGIASIVRIGSYVLNVTLTNLTRGPEPDTVAVEQLMARLVSRVESAPVASSISTGCLPTSLGQFGATMTGVALDAGTPDAMPGLDRCVQRFVGDGVEANLAWYMVRNGEMVAPFPAPPTAQMAENQAYITEIGVVHSYQSRYRINGPNGEAFIYIDIIAYANARVAQSRFDTIEERFRADSTFTVLEFEHDHMDLGDDSFRLSQRYDKNGNMWTVSGVRIDHMSVNVYATGLPNPIPDVVDQLLVSQVACMEANDCTAPLPAPPALFDGMLHRTT